MLKHYTVISLDEFEREVEVDTFEAESAMQAMVMLAKQSDDDRLILGAYESSCVHVDGGGMRTMTPDFHTPGDDNSSPACAKDLREDLEL